MPATASFLSTCLAAAQATPEYAAFNAALATLSAAAEDQRQAAWCAAYSDGQAGLSPAYRLRRAARDAVANAMVSQGVVLSPPDAEAAYQTLAAQLAPDSQPPAPVLPGSPAFTAEDFDLIRMTLARLAGD